MSARRACQPLARAGRPRRGRARRLARRFRPQRSVGCAIWPRRWRRSRPASGYARL